MKAPGVYVVEQDGRADAVEEVPTAVPAFIGHTAKADHGGEPLLYKPWRISSMAEYREHFGAEPTPRFDLKAVPPGCNVESTFTVEEQDYYVEQVSGAEGRAFLLYRCMESFFLNGGGACYVVCVGDYETPVEAQQLIAGIHALEGEHEPTMVVIPDAVLLSHAQCMDVQRASLMHCGQMASRIALLDVHGGYADRSVPSDDPIAQFRNALGTDHLDYGVAYYPWLHMSIVGDGDLGVRNVRNRELLGLDGAAEVADDALAAASPAFASILPEMKRQLNLLPPSAAIAGVYAMVDSSRGVWKAPAHVALNGVVAPAVALSHEDQEDLNVTPQGKSINAIRAFVGEGVLVWGARTLDGNSNDWKYVNVRRTLIMLEESIKRASGPYVRAENDASTWVCLKNAIRGFLTSIWQRGGLAGATEDDAFSVHIGLGETMTPEDLVEGVLRVTVLVAVSRPAEFIEITFQQRMARP